MANSNNITWVEFYNEKENVFIKIPMEYDSDEEVLSVEQRCLAYDELAAYVSEDFIHDTVIHAYWKEGK